MADVGKPFKKEYEKVKEDMKLVDMNNKQLAGYYLVNYPNAPIDVLLEDITNLRVPYIVGMHTKTLLEFVRGK